MTLRFTESELRRAARVATETGVTVVLMAPDGRKVIVAPQVVDIASELTDKESARCDQVFGTS